jgi:hypothetical protein
VQGQVYLKGFDPGDFRHRLWEQKVLAADERR